MSADFQNNYPPEGEYDFVIRKIMRGKGMVIGLELGGSGYQFPVWFDLDTAQGNCALAAFALAIPRHCSIQDLIGRRVTVEVGDDGRVEVVKEAAQ